MVGQSWVGLQLDKDIIGNGKLYSPDTCVFVSPQVNSFIKSSGYRGICLRGVTRLPGGRFRADGVNESGDRVYLGVFATNEDAHLAWAKDKAATANMLAAKQSDLRVAGGLRRFAVELLDGLTLG